MSLELALDLVLAASIVTLAVLTLAVRQLFTAIVLYISLGLLAALVWSRLGAWDIAIAEVAIGAGLTGALLLAAWQQLCSDTDPPDEPASASAKEQVKEQGNDVS